MSVLSMGRSTSTQRKRRLPEGSESSSWLLDVAMKEAMRGRRRASHVRLARLQAPLAPYWYTTSVESTMLMSSCCELMPIFW